MYSNAYGQRSYATKHQLPGNVTVLCATEVPPANAMAITATDGCGGTVGVIHHKDSISNFICTNRYLVNRIYKATDACGNEAFVLN